MAADTNPPSSAPGVHCFSPKLTHVVQAPQGAAAPLLLDDSIRAAAQALGFSHFGVTRTLVFDADRERFAAWLSAGFHGEMQYLAAPGRAAATDLLPHVKSIIVVALPHDRPRDQVVLRRQRDAPGNLLGSVGAYAWGADYHDVLRHKLLRLAQACADLLGKPLTARPCVDTAPFLERAAARSAGLGFTGKSTLEIIPGLGSYFLLGELLIDVELEATPPIALGCGTCIRCLDACPTQAFAGEYLLDARRCISYLTIEFRGIIPVELRALLGNHVFGCDICQDVCPYNASPKAKPSTPELAARGALLVPDLVEWLELTSAGYRRLVQGSALRRASRAQLGRNAAIALGNSRNPLAAAALCRALRENTAALVRGHAAWALGELGFQLASRGWLRELQHAQHTDADPWVRTEAEAAFARLVSLAET